MNRQFTRIIDPVIDSTEIFYDGEILPDGTVNVRRVTVDKDAEGNVISTKNHRHVIFPGDDYSDEPEEVQVECRREHTVEKVNARAAFVLAQQELL